jgi:metal-responsive CopG/Arc/MetJ family transcriptional regulator
MKRGAVRKKDSSVLAIWLPKSTLSAIDLAIAALETDRSHFIRAAIRKHLRECKPAISRKHPGRGLKRVLKAGPGKLRDHA